MKILRYLSEIKKYLLKLRPYVVYIIVFLVCVCVGLVWYGIFRHYSLLAKNKEIIFDQYTKTQPVSLYVSPLDGQPVMSVEETSVQVIGIMIDNHPNAWPQSGVSEAKIVYEAMVEGGLTRYFALYDSRQDVVEIGPVRSARLYFLDWIQEYGDGLYVHSGGSPQALAAIKPRNIFDANEFSWGRFFWRGKDHFAPHNLYTSSDDLQEMLDYRARSSTLFSMENAWKYAKEVGETLATSSQLTINFNVYYIVGWNYDTNSLKYQRSINGRPEKDKNGSEVWARNIVVQFTDIEDIINDDKGRQEVKTVGSGEAIILGRGGVVYGTWKKEGREDRTRFYDKEGEEVVLMPGNTWVEVVPKEVRVEIN